MYMWSGQNCGQTTMRLIVYQTFIIGYVVTNLLSGKCN